MLLERTTEERPELMILGTAHFANPGRDVFNPEVDDVLSGERQEQVAWILQQLRAFSPTYVAVEFSRADQTILDQRYTDYRNDRYKLGVSETDQLGLRLAALLNLARVHAIDWNGRPPGKTEDYDWMRYAGEHAPERLEALTDPARMCASYVALQQQTLGAWLRQLNDPERLAATHRIYFDIASFGDEERHPGAHWVGSWYARNLRIFGNLIGLNAQGGDRIVVVYGFGHAYLLRQFAQESGAFALVDVADILPEE